jgi:SAM-dependent methyltransferase
MNTDSSHQEWFQEWFNETYKTLYSHRHNHQAETQVDSLLNLGIINSDARILDAACGAGRHMLQFKKKKFSITGFDLSPSLLNDTVKSRLSVIRADMRFLPYVKNQFNLITCFFSSFGYFSSQNEDVNVLKSFKDMLTSPGHIFLDLINKEHLLSTLIPEDEKVINGLHIKQSRRIKNNQVIKTIIVRNGDAEIKTYKEQVRLYSLAEITDICKSISLNIIHKFGTETGDPYHKSDSPRMALLLKKNS